MSFHKSKYPENWKEISHRIRYERSNGRCECLGHCGLHNRNGQRRCEEMNHTNAKWAKGKVFLTVAHLCHHTDCDNEDHLAAMCNRCHLRYDRFLHQTHARKKRESKSKQLKFA